jgi:hypothetical protein
VSHGIEKVTLLIISLRDRETRKLKLTCGSTLAQPQIRKLHTLIALDRLVWVVTGKDRFWPGPEILAINLIAKNQPFDSTWHEKFRCNRHGRLMAG